MNQDELKKVMRTSGPFYVFYGLIILLVSLFCLLAFGYLIAIVGALFGFVVFYNGATYVFGKNLRVGLRETWRRRDQIRSRADLTKVMLTVADKLEKSPR